MVVFCLDESLAGRVIDGDRRAFRGESLGDGYADALGRAGDDGGFTCEFHDDGYFD